MTQVQQAAADSGFAHSVKTLENGLCLVSVPMPHLHVAELVCYLAVGGRCEEPDVSGISHFLEHMVFRGTEDYATSTELERAFERLGGAVNASTDVETTCFHSRLHPQHVAAGVALFASLLRRPSFADIDTERRIILEESREDFNEEGVQINQDNLMVALLWPDHPLGDSLIGTPETLARIDLARLKDYYRRWYVPENMVICACGPIDEDEVVAAVEREFGDWRGAAPPALLEAPDVMLSGSGSCWVEDSDSQVVLQLAFVLPGRADERIPGVLLLRRILSWGGGSRLPLRLREELGLTYAVEANCSLLSDCGYLAIDLAVARENLVEAVTELLRVLDELRVMPVPADELDATVQSYLYDLEFSQDQTEAQAIRYGWGLQVDYLRTMAQDRKAVKQITAAQLQQIAGEFLTRERARLVVVGPWQDADRSAVEQLLADF
jgi:predicted Zn-dependent peptidase